MRVTKRRKAVRERQAKLSVHFLVLLNLSIFSSPSALSCHRCFVPLHDRRTHDTTRHYWTAQHDEYCLEGSSNDASTYACHGWRVRSGKPVAQHCLQSKRHLMRHPLTTRGRVECWMRLILGRPKYVGMMPSLIHIR